MPDPGQTMSADDAASRRLDTRRVEDRANAAPTLWDPLNAWPAARRWLWMLLAVLACWLQGPDFIDNLRPPLDPIVDFFQDWASARNLFQGLRVYTPHDVTIPRYLGAGTVWTDVDLPVNAHPPLSVLVALPFAALDYPDAVLAWNLLSLAILAVTLWGIARALGMRLSRWSVFPILALALTCAPLRQQVVHGQFNPLLLFLLTGVWLADRSERHVLAGALLGVAAALKLFPAVLLLYFAARRQWTVLAAALVTLALLCLLTTVVLGTETSYDYLGLVLRGADHFKGHYANISVWAFWSRLFDPTRGPRADRWEALCESPGTALVGSVISCLLIAGAAGWVAHRSQSRLQRDHAFGIATIAMLLVSPISWDHYLLLLAPALAMSWIRLRASDCDRVVFFFVAMILWAQPVSILVRLFPLHGNATYVHSLAFFSVQCYALLALFVFSIVQFYRLARE